MADGSFDIAYVRVERLLDGEMVLTLLDPMQRGRSLVLSYAMTRKLYDGMTEFFRTDDLKPSKGQIN